MSADIKRKGGFNMKKKLVFPVMLVCLLALGLTFTGCPTDDGGDDPPGTPSTTSYTYSTSGGYEMIITKTNPLSVSMKSIYPGGDYRALSSAVLSKGETAKFTLRYNGVVISTGEILMGESYATFTPASGKPSFTGTIGDSVLSISDTVTPDDGTSPITLSPMNNITDQVAAFAEYWGVWNGLVQGYPVRLTIGDRTWELYINGRFDSSGVWVQASANSVRSYRLVPLPQIYVGTTTLKPDGGMTIVLTAGAYPGTYDLSR
jgi:hypothetical protein